MTRNWVNFFGSEEADLLRHYRHWTYHAPLWDLLVSTLPRGSRILDIGCGLGDTALLLAAYGYSVIGIDREEALLARAREAAERLGVETVVFEKGDLMNLRPHHARYDAVLSLGLMEHFDPPEAARLLADQARCANRVIVNIPSVWARLSVPFVDERPYHLRDLRRLGRRAGLVVEKNTGYGDVRGRFLHEAFRQLAPRGCYRWLQKRGYATSLTAVFRRNS